MMRNSSIFLKGSPIGHSKQFISTKRMFGGNRGKTLRIGKKFKSSGNLKASSISPDTDSYEEMMNSISKGSSFGKKKSLFKKKGY